jgi:hypothetical protein
VQELSKNSVKPVGAKENTSQLVTLVQAKELYKKQLQKMLSYQKE